MRLIDIDKIPSEILDGIVKNEKLDLPNTHITVRDILETQDGIISKDATNEDILKAIFPNDADNIIKYIKIFILNGWLNAKYERLEDGKSFD